MKQTIEIEVPEGYEVSEGEQPRLPKEGEYYLHNYKANEAGRTHTWPVIILKKKAPKYWKGERYDAHTNYKMYDVVEIKALEDALELIDSYMASIKTIGNESDKATYKALKTLMEA